MSQSFDQGDDHVEPATRDLLNFYGVQLQSHAGALVGLAVLLFGVVQAWGQLASAELVTNSHAYLFSVLGGLIGASIEYEVLRLYTYGKLASALTFAGIDTFREMKQKQIEIHGSNDWANKLPLNKAAAFANWPVVKYSLLVKMGLFSPTLGVKHLVEAFSFVTAFFLSYASLFGATDHYELFQWPAGASHLIVMTSLGLVLVTSYARDKWNDKRLAQELAARIEATRKRGNGVMNMPSNDSK